METSSPPFRIRPLGLHPEAVETVSRFLFEEWLETQGGSLAGALSEVKGRLHVGQLPTTLVAFQGMEVVGMASLRMEEKPYDPEPVCCLTGLFVVPGHRSRGIGGALCAAALAEAARLGESMLSLYTANHEAYYARLGWHKVTDTVVGRGRALRTGVFMERATANL